VLTDAEQAAWEAQNRLAPGVLDGLGDAATAGAAPAPDRHRVLLMSHGLGETTAFLTAHAADLASHGYVVVGIDHPGDSVAVEVGGRIVGADPATARHKLRAVAQRVRDLHLALDRLGALRGVGGLDTTTVGAFGHSMGGAASAGAMLADRRIAAAVDMDGSLYGPVTRQGLDRPFGTMAQDGMPRAAYGGPAFRRRLTGPHPFARFPGTAHHGFTDYVWLAPQLGIDPAAADVGTVDPATAVAQQNAWLKRFFDRHLRAG
jgi:dienelactone hydrolase